MEKNMIKICCDPYNKQVQYFWLEETEMWSNLSEDENSPFNSESFMNTSLSHNAYSVLDILVKHYYSRSVGLEIVFEGTDDDFEDLESIRRGYFDEYDIEIIKGSRRMQSAKDVMPKIEKIFQAVEKYFKEYPDANTEAVISKYRETVRPEIALCIMGLYSSGKSAFINSLIGREILPSDSDPATAKVYRIADSENSEIIFEFKGEEYKIKYDEKSWKSSKNIGNEIVSHIKSVLEEKNVQSIDHMMYWTLYALNNYAKMEGKNQHEELVQCANRMLKEKELMEATTDEKKVEKLLKYYRIKDLVEMGQVSECKLGPVIGVSCGFVGSYMPTDEFKFVIYDTPGSNSVQFSEHVDILKESLEEQTNGLPLFVATPDSMDGTDNNELITIIEELGGSLDISNMMLIVNKADEKSGDTLKEKANNKDNLVLTKWKANRVYFVSSVMGLGGKKQNNDTKLEWIHSDYRKIFKSNKEMFGNPKDEDYIRLFDYNIIPENEEKRIRQRVDKIDSSEVLLWNSGIPCVEEEIGMFARKYALYNKCEQAIFYLKEAIERVSEDVKVASQEAEKTRKNIEDRLENERTNLIIQLKGKCKEKEKKFQRDFAENVTNTEVTAFLDRKKIKDIVCYVYAHAKGKNDHEKVYDFNNGIENNLKKNIKDYSEKTSKKIIPYWERCADELREELMTIVLNNPVLTDKQKKELNEEIKVIKTPDMHELLNIKNTDAIKDISFFGWKLWTHIDINNSCEKYRTALYNDITSNNKKATTENEKEFEKWTERILNSLKTKIADFNPNLKELTLKLRKQESEVKTKEKQKQYIEGALLQINRLIMFEEVR